MDTDENKKYPGLKACALEIGAIGNPKETGDDHGACNYLDGGYHPLSPSGEDQTALPPAIGPYGLLRWVILRLIRIPVLGPHCAVYRNA